MDERKKNLINSSKLNDSQKLKLINEMDNFSIEELEQRIGEIENVKKKKSNIRLGKQDIFIIAIISIIGLIVLIMLTEDYSNHSVSTEEVDNKAIINEKNNSADMEKKKTPELTEAQKLVIKVGDLIDNSNLAFDAGSYIAGEIPVGEYAFIRFGDGRYYSEEDMAGNIIDNENFDSFGYVKVHGTGNLKTYGALINITAFEQLGVSSAKELYEKMNGIENFNQGGYYKVGVDILEGAYTIESIGGLGYYSKNTGPVGDYTIIQNNNFDGKVSVNLSNGQYLAVSRAIITSK